MKIFKNAEEAMAYVPSAEEYNDWFIKRVTASLEGLAAGTNKLTPHDVVKQIGIEAIKDAVSRRQN